MLPEFEGPLQIDVQSSQAVSPAIADSLGEDLRLESGRLQRRGCHKSRSIEPRAERSRTAADLVRVSIIENIAPLQQGTGLPFVGHRGLPAAGDRGSNPRAHQPLSLPERELVNPGGGESIGDATVTQFPTGAGVVYIVIIVAIAFIYGGEVGVDGEAFR